jgi:hypothetical protein
MSDLIVHAGGSKVERIQVEAVPTPQATATWQPIPHGELIGLVERNIGQLGFKIVNESYALARDGARFFGTLDLENCRQAEDYRIVVGLRNSHDMSFPAGLAMGSRVFVCDNLAFSGEVQIARKHTRYILRDLPTLANSAVGRLNDLREKQDTRIVAYKGTALADGQAHDIIVRAVDARVIPNQRIPDVLNEWRKPRHAEFEPRTAWSLFNAFTETLKDANRFDLPKRATALHGLMDQVAVLN